LVFQVLRCKKQGNLKTTANGHRSTFMNSWVVTDIKNATVAQQRQNTHKCKPLAEIHENLQPKIPKCVQIETFAHTHNQLVVQAEVHAPPKANKLSKTIVLDELRALENIGSDLFNEDCWKEVENKNAQDTDEINFLQKIGAEFWDDANWQTVEKNEKQMVDGETNDTQQNNHSHKHNNNHQHFRNN